MSLLAVLATGVLLLSEQFISANGATDYVKPELRNLVLVAGFAFLVNLTVVGALFERAVRISRPEQWQALRHDVNKRDVQKAVQAFLGRFQRAVAAQETNESDATILFPDAGEGSADEAIRALLGDARRAMSERRQQEFRRSLDYIWELVKYAMDEIKTTDIQWSAPGGQPEWPPLRELSNNLYSFREDVIREGHREYVLDLLRFDYRLTIEGMRERCGELFTVGLNGYGWNYRIANRIGGGEFREMLRDQFSLNAYSFVLGAEPVETFPYAKEMVGHQERLSSDAMHSDQPTDYDQLHKGFQASLQVIRSHWGVENWQPSKASELYQQLEQEYRIALMGLGGRALLLAQSNRIADVNPYLDVGRRAYTHLRTMADDLAPALLYGNYSGFSLWQEWETEGAEQYKAIAISPERYPLMFFTLRLMELSSETMPTLDLHGRAQRALDWFIDNSERVGAYVLTELGPSLEQRRELATEALRSAVLKDEVAEDCEIIARELSETRVAAFKSAVYAAAFSGNAVERLFKRAGIFLCLSGDETDVPEERFTTQSVPKGYLTDTTEGALTHYAPFNGDQWGRALSDDVLRRFCDELEGAPDISVPLETPAELLQVIDRAIEELNGPEHVVVVLTGNWFDLEFELNTETPEGYEADWRLPESDRMGGIGRYRGHPILSTGDNKGRCMYVVDPVGWGHFVRVKTDGDQDLRVDIKPISIDRARESLKANPDLFASQPDEESKLRKLQTYVEIVVGARTGFRVADTSRARRIVPIHRSDTNNEASQA